MPYISPDQRRILIPLIDAIEDNCPTSVGELNFLFTVIALEYLEKMGKEYRTINDVIGALEAAKLEFYRRAAAPYEDVKAAQNGDLYVP